MSYILVLMTASNKEEAIKIVHTLLKEKLVVCANIIEGLSSFYWWKGKIEEDKESLVIMKSHKNLFANISSRIRGLHSYDVAEILAIPIVDGSPSYIEWMKNFFEPVNKDE